MARTASPELAERRRRQILDAALACFRRRGFHQATMQEICAEAGISAGALYRYFGSKTDIIAAIAEDERGDNETLFSAANGSVLDNLCAVARGFFCKIASGDGALIADVTAEAARDPALAQSLARIDGSAATACAKLIRLGQARGELDSALDPNTATQALFSIIEGVGLRNTMLGHTDANAAVDQFHAIAERYLQVRP